MPLAHGVAQLGEVRCGLPNGKSIARPPANSLPPGVAGHAVDGDRDARAAKK
jgi:hypothetical protein